MRKNNAFKYLFVLISILIFGLTIISCDKEIEDDLDDTTQDVVDSRVFVEYSWEAVLDACPSMTEIDGVDSKMFCNERELNSFCTSNNLNSIVDDNGDYKDTTIGNVFKKYDEAFFLNNVLIIVPTWTTPSTYIYKINSVYLLSNKIYVQRECYLKGPHTDDEEDIFYFISINKQEFASYDLNLISFGEFCISND